MVPKMFQHMSLKPALMREALTNMKIHDSPSITTVTRNSMRVSLMNLSIAIHERFRHHNFIFTRSRSISWYLFIHRQYHTRTTTHYPSFFITATTPCNNNPSPCFLHHHYHTRTTTHYSGLCIIATTPVQQPSTLVHSSPLPHPYNHNPLPWFINHHHHTIHVYNNNPLPRFVHDRDHTHTTTHCPDSFMIATTPIQQPIAPIRS